MSKLDLPEAPANLSGPVKAWRQPVSIPTYQPMPADKNPMFLEKRVYQGSSGKVYPLPFTDRIAEEKTDQSWDAVHIENEFVRLMILPQIGGRIHIGLDKTNGYDFFYRQNVIKPALVGLAGPWISGGVEFNWPQHHRPSTFMPVDVHVENHSDGSVTIWCSEHEPMSRMKGMHGICLHPGKSVVELKVRLYNRTEFVQTFLWWANVATRVHEQYQSFFPPDVSYVADHAKRAMSRFPHCEGSYYGVDYARRRKQGFAPGEKPSHFVPQNDKYLPDDLSWYANIPVPTSYMAMGSNQDFCGGYDHAKEAGLVHWANHHISPGKKQWTWGNHEFGYAWDRNLTDEDGPYIELMAGVFTDNQPDFSFLHPGETRTFSQFWYPIQKIGPARKANLRAAVSLKVQKSGTRIGVAATEELKQASITLTAGGNLIDRRGADLTPGNPLVYEVAVTSPANLKLTVTDSNGSTIIEYAPSRENEKPVPAPATEPALPAEVATNDELYLIGVHLQQYRHATRDPAAYWHEAIRRDPADSRCNTALGIWHLRRGEFQLAVDFLTTAVESLTRRNPNPPDGEAFYHLGIALRYLGRDDQAYDALYKSTWNFPWQAPAFYALAEIHCRRQNWATALEHLDRTLRVNSEHLNARNLKSVVLRFLGRKAEATSLLHQTHELDPLDFWSIHSLGKAMVCDGQTKLDLALDFARAGFYQGAVDMLATLSPSSAAAEEGGCEGLDPLIDYHLAYFLERLGEKEAAAVARNAAKSASPDYCFPSRLDDILALQAAIDADLSDARAPYYLGNLCYDRRRHSDAIALWEKSAELDPTFSIVWRNLGIGYFNIESDAAGAKNAYERAFAANPADRRLLYELDQLRKRIGESPENRLAELERYMPLVICRDDLSVELCTLYNQVGKHDLALNILKNRRFQPWEGGEGLVRGQHVRTHLSLGRQALREGDANRARFLFFAAANCPKSLGEARHLLANQSEIFFWIGVASRADGSPQAAEVYWSAAANARGDFQEMSVRSFSETTYFSALSLQSLGRKDEADKLLRDLLEYARTLAKSPAKIDYFATSLPAMLLFEDDLQHRQTIHAKFLEAQAQLGLGEKSLAEKLLKEILRDDPNHALAADLLSSLNAEETHANR